MFQKFQGQFRTLKKPHHDDRITGPREDSIELIM